MEVQLAEFILKEGVNVMNLEVVAVSLVAQGISHYISLARGIRNTQVIVCNGFHPSLLTEIQRWLSEQVLQTLMIHVTASSHLC